MLKSDLVNLLVEKRKITQKQAEQTVEEIFDAMTQALVRGDNIEIRGLGAFHVKGYKGYKGRNPKTSVAIDVRPKRGVLFRTGKELSVRVNAAFDAERARAEARRADGPGDGEGPGGSDPTKNAA